MFKKKGDMYMSKHSITVIIPTHNRPEELRRAIRSVYQQTLLPDELIVVDDGSMPPITRDIFQGSPGNLKTILLRNNIPLGASGARNRGIENATSGWIAFLDDDDEFLPDKIEVVSMAIKNNPYCDFFYHPARINMVNERIIYTTNPREYKPEDDIFRLLLVKNEIAGTSMTVIKCSKLLKVHGFDEQLPALQDYELWIRLVKEGVKIKKINQVMTIYNYVTKRASISKSIKSCETATRMIEEKYKNDYASLSIYEKKRHEDWKQSMIVHKAILNGDICRAFTEQIKHFVMSPSPKNLLASLVILAGPKTVFWLRSRLG